MSEYRLKALAFQRLTFNFPQTAKELYAAAGTAEEINACRNDVRSMVPDASDALCSLLASDWSVALHWAEKELAWCEKKGISFLCPEDEDYPQRLRNCLDAPVGLFFLGSADLNARHAVSIVGTRQNTAYGRDCVERLVSDLKAMVPDVVIFSGLAYGIDVCAHRAALAAGADTVGVVAHGLDTMYPASHRGIAAEMLAHGGVVSEYPSGTRCDRHNFLRRNRIVAALGDCTVVAESKAHGGSLVTARLANDYNREVFAFPGRVGDDASEGCNSLIHDNKAAILLSARDIVDGLGWQTVQRQDAERKKGVQLEAFPELSPEQQKIVDVLGDGDTQLNTISLKSGLPIGKIAALLFELEMQGMVRPYAGGMYHLNEQGNNIK
ncbi:MAG: DNA-processing protein DprA [Bacteroidales bacterium]|nr:DNA-processing protein DprA [Bacteroidales bacterium]MCM1146886.1 DNA-processing protein DprA [Bacteroidales bacterium]MCM1205616.1 DNA-processing protein DprA [Bacillota bacterium]MCM1510273.1 DNA-processing protein DprA [Clostridium sp.]